LVGTFSSIFIEFNYYKILRQKEHMSCGECMFIDYHAFAQNPTRTFTKPFRQ